MRKRTKIALIIFTLKITPKSSWNTAPSISLEKVRGVPEPPNPKKYASTVDNTILIKTEPGTLNFRSIRVEARPKYNTYAIGEKNTPTPLIATPLYNNTPARRNAISMRKTPTQRAKPDFILSGIALIIFVRTFVKVSIMNNTPDQNTAPSASCQVNPSAKHTKNATYAFISIPGATANGFLAHTPIINVARKQVMTVAKKTALLLNPPSASIDGFTTKI